MARKMKGKASRKAKGLKHSKRVKAKQVKAAPKKSKLSNRKRSEARVPLGEAYRQRQSEDAIEASMPGGPQRATPDDNTDPPGTMYPVDDNEI